MLRDVPLGAWARWFSEEAQRISFQEPLLPTDEIRVSSNFCDLLPASPPTGDLEAEGDKKLSAGDVCGCP